MNDHVAVANAVGSTPNERVLVLTPDLSQPGGVVNYYKTLRLDTLSNVSYFFVNRRDTRSLWSKAYHACFIYADFIREARFCRLIHINPSLNRKSYYRDMVFIVLSLLMRKRVLVFFRGWEGEFARLIRTSKVRKMLFRQSYGKADQFIVLGQVFKHQLLALGVDRNTPIEIETTVADSRGMVRFNLECKLTSVGPRFRFLFMSRILEAKGIFTAIQSFARCRARISGVDVVLSIAGSGPDLRRARSFVTENGYTGIEFVGEVSGAEKASLLEACHVMFFPTCYDEGLPNCILEGMLYGMPIVSRNTAAIPEIVAHGVNGFLSDSIHASAFDDYLCRLVTDQELYRRIARTNHQIACARFTTEKVRERLLAIYRNLLCAA